MKPSRSAPSTASPGARLANGVLRRLPPRRSDQGKRDIVADCGQALAPAEGAHRRRRDRSFVPKRPLHRFSSSTAYCEPPLGFRASCYNVGKAAPSRKPHGVKEICVTRVGVPHNEDIDQNSRTLLLPTDSWVSRDRSRGSGRSDEQPENVGSQWTRRWRELDSNLSVPRPGRLRSAWPKASSTPRWS
jgi:hypothetical protein